MKKKILTVIGARPQFIKASAISRTFRTKFPDEVEEVMLHTGQHYDAGMSEVFFQELELPEASYHLETGSMTHGKQTAAMMVGIEEAIDKEKPDAMIVYGDTNSTLAGAMAAVKLHVPLVHIEAGLRSFRKEMPEEINRILCDHVSTLLFTPSLKAVEHLLREGFHTSNKPPYNINNPGIFHCGDIMYDNALYFIGRASEKPDILKENKLESGAYILFTLHRYSNTDHKEKLEEIFHAVLRIAAENNIRVVAPLHPRTQKMLKQSALNDLRKKLDSEKLYIELPAVSYMDMLLLERHADMVMTDSGGVQKESYFFEKKCIVLRDETEWTELLDVGSAMLAGSTTESILKAFRILSSRNNIFYPKIFGDGKAALFIAEKMIQHI